MNSFLNTNDLYHSAPLLLLGAGGLFVLLLETFARMKWATHSHRQTSHSTGESSEAHGTVPWGSRFFLLPFTWLLVAGALILVIGQIGQLRNGGAPWILYQGMLQVDMWGLLTLGICLVAALLTLPSLPLFAQTRDCETGESYALILFSLAGAAMLVMAQHWLVVFLGLETLSLGIYVLTGTWRKSSQASEAALKYFIIGGFVAALLLYGIALVYGSTGSVFIRSTTGRTFSEAGIPLLQIGACLVLASLAFKVAAVPFHMWAPDVYQGAPTPITGLMMSLVKTAGFSILVRLGITFFQQASLAPFWEGGLYVMTALTLLIGNLGALRQTHVKRLLAYSSIAHVGYLLLGLLATRHNLQAGLSALLFYLGSYTLASVGIMGVITWVSSNAHPTEEKLELAQWEGLSKRNPTAAFLMTLFLLTLGGVPPMAGFFAKFLLFRLAFVDSMLRPLVWIALLGTLLSMGYYLRVIRVMYFREPVGEHKPLPPLPHLLPLVLALVIAVVGTFVLGLLPGGFLSALFSVTMGLSS